MQSRVPPFKKKIYIYMLIDQKCGQDVQQRVYSGFSERLGLKRKECLLSLFIIHAFCIAI